MRLLWLLTTIQFLAACQIRQDKGFMGLTQAQEAILSEAQATVHSASDLTQLNWQTIQFPRTLVRETHSEYLVQRIELPSAPYQQPAILFERIHQSFRIELDGEVIMKFGNLEN